MSTVNETIIVGRLGRDPEVRFQDTGNPKTTFSVATDEKWKNKDGELQEHTEWFNVVVWGGQAEPCGKYLSKGRQVYVRGRTRTREYEKDGVKKYITELIARDVVFLGSKSDGNATHSTERHEANEDIPF